MATPLTRFVREWREESLTSLHSNCLGHCSHRSRHPCSHTNPSIRTLLLTLEPVTDRSHEQICLSLRQLPHSSITCALLSTHCPQTATNFSVPGNWHLPLQSVNGDLSLPESRQTPHSSCVYACCCGRESSGGMHRPRQSLAIDPLTSLYGVSIIWSKNMLHY